MREDIHLYAQTFKCTKSFKRKRASHARNQLHLLDDLNTVYLLNEGTSDLFLRLIVFASDAHGIYVADWRHSLKVLSTWRI